MIGKIRAGLAAFLDRLLLIQPIGLDVSDGYDPREPYPLDVDITVPLNATPPHCDPLVLHRPGSCKYCDGYPAVQRNRQRAHVRFTGEESPASYAPCPSELHRSADLIHEWPGNRPTS